MAEGPLRQRPRSLVNVPSRFAVWWLDGYKRWLSPLLPRSCRFAPTCSEYTRLAVIEYGALRGVLRGMARILRCNPFHPGGVDLP